MAGKKYPQVGKSDKELDLRFAAKSPGWRTSASGKEYFENRANRSDKSKRKRV